MTSALNQSETPSAPVIITGYGLVTPLGHSAWETFAQLLAGRTTADRLAKLEAGLPPTDVARAVGGVNIAAHSGDPAIELAERAAREAIFMADRRSTTSSNAKSSNTSPITMADTVFIMGSSKGAIHTLIAAADEVHAKSHGRTTRLGPPPPADAHLAAVLGPHGYLSHHLSRRLGCGPIRQVVGACASSLIALHQARQMLTCEDPASRPKRVVVLTCEAALHELFIASYARLGVMPSLAADDQGQYHYRCLPLDTNRQGFILGQMGAAIVLESSQNTANHDSGHQPGDSLILADTAHAADGHDIIRSEPSMAALSHVAQKLLKDRDIDLIHAHATGTREHDEAELKAYAPLLQKQTSPADVYAVKGAIGHGLGAAGLVSTIIACLCAQSGRRPPMPWLDSPVKSPAKTLSISKTCNGSPCSKFESQAIFAAGFGGHVAGAVVTHIAARR